MKKIIAWTWLSLFACFLSWVIVKGFQHLTPPEIGELAKMLTAAILVFGLIVFTCWCFDKINND